MKKSISLIVLILIFTTGITWAEDNKSNLMIHNIKLEMIEDGKLIDAKEIVDIHIFDYKGKVHATWKQVSIIPWQKKVSLAANCYSSLTGDITDILVHDDNTFEFSFKLGVYSMKIVGNKKGKESVVRNIFTGDNSTVTGVGVYRDSS